MSENVFKFDYERRIDELDRELATTIRSHQQANAEVMELGAEVDRLRKALDCIPAALMLTVGPPYVLNISESALREIDAALREEAKR